MLWVVLPENGLRRPGRSGNPDGVLAFVTEQLAAKPERADVVHDLLAFLAE